MSACSCGSGIKPCEIPAHLRAVAYSMHIHLQSKDFKHAMQCATQMITLAPARPEGYLALEKVHSLQNPHPTAENLARREWLYVQGFRTVCRHGKPDSKLSKVLRSRVRRDIVKYVPTEVSAMILGHLSHADLERAICVSRIWRYRCRNPVLWKKLKFMNARKGLQPGVLNDIILHRSAGLATSVTIHDLWGFGIYGAKLGALLRALPRLKTLDIAGYCSPMMSTAQSANSKKPAQCDSFSNIWEAICRHAPATLTEVSLSYFQGRTRLVPPPFTALQQSWQRDTKLAGSLERFHLANISSANLQLVLVGTICRNTYLKLATLSILNPEMKEPSWWPADEKALIPIDGLLQSAPNLEDFAWEGRMCAYARAGVNTALWPPNWIPVHHHALFPGAHAPANAIPISTWPHLRRLRHAADDVWRWSPLSAGMRSLEIESYPSAQGVLNANHPAHPTALPSGLEHFRCVDDAHTCGIRLYYSGLSYGASMSNPFFFLIPAIRSGHLRSLDIVYVNNIRAVLDATFEDNKGVLHTLSCSDMTMPSTVNLNNGNWMDCIKMMSTFPNLKTVGLFPPKAYENAWMVVSTFINMRPDIKTIYTNSLTKGAIRDEVLSKAAKNGVMIVEAERIPELDLQFPPPPPWVRVEEVVDDEVLEPGKDATEETD